MKKEKILGVGVGVMILQKNKVLLGHRNIDPVKAGSLLHGEGTWTMPGGRLEFGEGLADCAYREVLEETGLKINPKKLKLISLTDDISDKAHFVTAGFLCKEFKGSVKTMEPEEITEWQWFDLKKLPQKIFSPSAKILKNYGKKALYDFD